MASVWVGPLFHCAVVLAPLALHPSSVYDVDPWFSEHVVLCAPCHRPQVLSTDLNEGLSRGEYWLVLVVDTDTGSADDYARYGLQCAAHPVSSLPSPANVSCGAGARGGYILVGVGVFRIL